MKNRWLPVSLLALIALLIVFEPSYGWQVRNFFARGMASAGDDGTMPTLQEQTLEAEIAKLQSVQAQLPETVPNYLRAMVYSRYPFNFKNELLIDIGKNEGVAANAAVVFDGALIGKIKVAYSDTSIVTTVFDSGFQMPVRVGSAGVDALLKGGTLPMATLIPLKAIVSSTAIVYSATQGAPYGLPIATIGTLGISSDQLFQEASLDFGYDINAIQTVLVAKQ